MNKFSLLFLILFQSTIIVKAQEVQKKDFTINPDNFNKEQILDISQYYWSFQAGDDINWSKGNFDDRDWEIRKSYWFEDSLKQEDSFKGICWLRMHFEIDSTLLNKILYLEIRQPGACEVYLDGNLIGNMGKPDTDPNKILEYPTLFQPKAVYQLVENSTVARSVIPFSLINNKKHLLAIRFSYHKYNDFHPYIRKDHRLKGIKVSILNYDYNQSQQEGNSFLGYNYWNNLMIFMLVVLGFLFLCLYLFFNNNNLNLSIGVPFFLIGLQSLFIYKFSVYLPYEYQYLITSYWTAILNVPQYFFMVILAYYILFFRKIPTKVKYFYPLIFADILLRLLNSLPMTYNYHWVKWYGDGYYYNHILQSIVLCELLRITIVGTFAKKTDIMALVGTFFIWVAYMAGLFTFIVLHNGMYANGFWVLCLLSLGILAAMSMVFRNGLVLRYLQKKLIEVKKLSSEKEQILENQKTVLETQVQERTIQLKETNEELAQSIEELKLTSEIIESKSKLILERNKEITDSITYAKNIQDAMLPSLSYIKEYIPELFILFKPRDIVSGDFYFFSEKNGYLIIAAVDCTGHGVPGAFMSMIGNDILINLVEIRGITEADLILNELHKGIRAALKQNETKNRDGMDISLLVIDRQNNLVEFAGAKNPLIYIQNNILYEVDANKFPIGGEQREMNRVFDRNIIKIGLEAKTTFYLFSDGYQDQFGGFDNKKFMKKRIKEQLLQIHALTMEEQRDVLEKNITDWMSQSDEKQIDDMLAIGIRI